MSSRRSAPARPLRALLATAALLVGGLALGGMALGGLISAGLTSGSAAAQTQAAAQTPSAPPCRQAVLVVAGGAGSGTDLIARAVADAANRAGIKPPLRVRNIDGNSGIDGARTVMEAPADGCMMLAAHQGLLANFLTWKAPFAWHEFRHVALLTRTPMVLVAPTGAPYTDALEMFEAARDMPVTAAVGPGTVGEFAMRAMAKAMAVDLEYDSISGARDRLKALLADEVDVMPVPTALARRLRETQQVRPLAVTDREASTVLPDLTTLRDQGVPFDYAIEIGVLLPGAASEELAARLAGDLEKALADPALRTALAAFDVRVEFRALTQYTIYWENLMASWREIAVEAGYDRATR